MSRGRKLIFAQVVISAIALAVVYATLLSPADDNPLFGVEAPNEIAPSDGSSDGKRVSDKGDGKSAGDSDDTAQGNGGETVAPGTLTSPASDPGSPVFTQYRDSLSQLRGRLAP